MGIAFSLSLPRLETRFELQLVRRADKDNESIFDGIGNGASSCPAPYFLGIAGTKHRLPQCVE